MARRGYDEVQVDEQIERIELAVRRGDDPRVLAEQVRAARFSRAPVGRLGYAMNQVDGLLGRVLRDLTGESPHLDWHRNEPGQRLLTDRAAVRQVRRQSRDAARSGQAALRRGAEPEAADRLATLGWARMLQGSDYGDPLVFLLYAVLPAVALTVIVIQTLAKLDWNLGAALVGCVLVGLAAGWVWLSSRAVRRRRAGLRWLKAQRLAPPDTDLSDLFADDPRRD